MITFLKKVSDMMTLWTTGWFPLGLWNEQNRGPQGRRDFEDTVKIYDSNQNAWDEFYQRIKMKPWSVFLINSGNHFLAAFLHLEVPQGAMDTDDDDKSYTYVKNVFIADPRPITSSSNLIFSRIRMILEREQFDVAADAKVKIDIPVQVDDFSCGIHTYVAVRTFMQRFHALYTTKNELSQPSLWKDWGKFTNVEEERGIMMGVCAAQAMKDKEYRARLALVPTSHVKNLKGTMVQAESWERRKARKRSAPKPSQAASSKRQKT
ncbi:hypothetical protein F4778DRAFT_760381 [Xylariomycetidae sp. FL2044]|nr:hypothetical protein F4778DRAFT_760337 [Xylariomycetidae sp. FL2044]KAH9885740.1 hypothetical protein F4778DRAFT_760381 [Xylariomycetidae sp. FL2044]